MLKLWSEPEAENHGASNRCCTLEALDDAHRVALKLRIHFYVLNCEAQFREHVVDYFVREYAAGRTPNPCLACNRHIKFGLLMQAAATLNAEYLATGHYARVVEADGQYHLLRGRDAGKDQSYVLYQLTQEQLRRVLFPVGDYSKAEVRAIAADAGLPVAGKAESQDLCFVYDQDYRRFLQMYAPDIVRPGPILDVDGREIGQHQGLPFYTIGQRKGLGITGPAPLYVRAVDVARNALIVGTAAQLGRTTFQASQVSFISGQPPAGPVDVAVQVRSTGKPVAATLTPGEGDTVNVSLATPLRDITPGQAAVFYQGEYVLGGGIII